MNYFLYSCFLFLVLFKPLDASAELNKFGSCESFEFLNPQWVKPAKSPKDFKASKIFYESKKNHRKGKKLLLRILKNPSHPDYETAVNYAGDSLSKKLRRASTKALKNIFGEIGSPRFFENSCAYFKQNDGSFLYREAIENLHFMASHPRFLLTKAQNLTFLFP